MRILALIPARGGSKRLPGKNIRLLAGKPLIAWSIGIAKCVPEVCETLVSTDDPEIEAVARAAGGYVPWLRPSVLATDEANSVDVALHALDWFEAERGPVDGLLLLQPTSPFRTRKEVRKGIELFSVSGRKPILGVSPAPAHPMWTFALEDGRLVPFIKGRGLDSRSQDLPKAYVLNGSFYLISPEDLRAQKSFVGRNSIPLLAESPLAALDIDTEWDWQLAEFLHARQIDFEVSDR